MPAAESIDFRRRFPLGEAAPPPQKRNGFSRQPPLLFFGKSIIIPIKEN